jgi:branched-chain amino acid aminotransferase
MSEPLAYLNGQYLPQSQAALTLHDAGFVFGATVTDLARTFRLRPFRLADHIARFRQSCALCQVPLRLDDVRLNEVAERLIEHNGALLGKDEGIPLYDGQGREVGRFLPANRELALVLFATPGPIGYYLGQSGGPGDGPPTLGLHTFPLPFARYRPLFAEGARLVVPPTRHVPTASVDPRAKMRSRMFWWIAEQQAKDIEPGASALLLDADGFVTETAAANFLIVHDGTVISPLRSSILGGVSLQVVEELCAELGIPFAELPLTLAECQSADEALLSGTAFCVAGVRRLHGVELPWPGPVWRRLLAAWSERVGVDIAAQILQ